MHDVDVVVSDLGGGSDELRQFIQYTDIIEKEKRNFETIFYKTSFESWNASERGEMDGVAE